MRLNERVILFAAEGGQRARTAFRTGRTPLSWPQRALAVALVVILGLPLLLVATVVAIAVLILLAAWLLWRALRRRLARFLPRQDGRSNVRVIRRE